MAIRRVRPSSALLAVAAVAGLVALVPNPAAASPTPASPGPHSVAAVQRQLSALAVQNTALDERYDQAQILVTRRAQAAQAAQLAAARAAATYVRAHAAFAQVIQAQYEQGDDFGGAGALLTSASPGAYLDALNTQSLVSAHLSQVLAEESHDRSAARTAQAQAGAALTAARSDRAALAAQRAALAAQIGRYRKLLATLTAAQQVVYQHSQNPAVNVTTVAHLHLTKASTAAAAQAVSFALAQVGKWYEPDGAGPQTYDCSGLTMRAWGSAGVKLPHSAAEQYDYGHHVPADVADLQPGDLIFFYEPIEHVTIYVGNGLMVSAPEPGERVSVIPLHGTNAPIVGATRLTG